MTFRLLQKATQVSYTPHPIEGGKAAITGFTALSCDVSKVTCA